MIGDQYPQPDARGWLVFDALSSDLRNSEDATAAADSDRAGARVGTFTRPATATERTLLIHLGFTLPTDLETLVRFLSPGVRNRRWPQLESEVAP